MSRRNDRLTCLIAAQTRLKIAADTLRWALSAETRDVLPHDEILAVVEQLHGWAGAAASAVRDDKIEGR